MSDDEFLAALESCLLKEQDFGHAAHVRAAYLYSRSAGFAGALEKIRRALCSYAAALGKAERFHETITVACLTLIRQQLHERGDGGGWEGFAQANPEFLERDLLLKHYPRTQLESELARKSFVLPRYSGAAKPYAQP
jgi:hypothetical protein